jgi:hypothetical protein
MIPTLTTRAVIWFRRVGAQSEDEEKIRFERVSDSISQTKSAGSGGLTRMQQPGFFNRQCDASNRQWTQKKFIERKLYLEGLSNPGKDANGKQ